MSWPAASASGPLLAPARHPAVDEARVAGEALVGPDAEPLGHAGPEPLEERVGTVGEPGAGRPRHRRRLEVDRDRAAAAAEHVEASACRVAADGTATRSTRMTSAPRSASTIAQNGPGPMPATSMTRSPASGPIAGSAERRCEAAPATAAATEPTARTRAGPNSRLAQATWPSSTCWTSAPGMARGQPQLLLRADGAVAVGDHHGGGHVDLADPPAGAVAADGLAGLHQLHEVVAAHLPRRPRPEVAWDAPAGPGCARRAPKHRAPAEPGARSWWCPPPTPSSS